MSDSIKFRMNDSIIRQADRLNSNQSVKQRTEQKNDQKTGFKDLLNQEIKKSITFTKHANVRKEQRAIEVSEADLEKLGNACDQAQDKGIKNALIMMNQSAFIVNAANKRVITVMDQHEMKDKCVNDIDGALFI